MRIKDEGDHRKSNTQETEGDNIDRSQRTISEYISSNHNNNTNKLNTVTNAVDSMSGVGQEVELERSQENRQSETLEVEDVVSADTGNHTTKSGAAFRTSSHVLNGSATQGVDIDKKGSGTVGAGNELNRGSELYKNRIGVDSALQYNSTKGAVMYGGDTDSRPKLDTAGMSGNRS